MKDVLLFYRDDCGYCDRAHRALAELMEANPAYREIPLTMVEETREPELADRYDYYAVPAVYVDGKKKFEAHLFRGYEQSREELRSALDLALT